MIRWQCAYMALLVSVLAGCGSSSEVSDAPAIRPAKLIEIQASTDIRTLTLPAVIEAQSSAELTFQVGGLLAQLNVRSGQRVQAGDLIAQLDQRDFANDLTQAQAQFDQAASEFGRAERLIKESAISRSVFEQRQSQLEVATAALDSARKRLGDTELRAPFDGVIAQVAGEAFQTISARELIAVIQSTGAALAVAQIPATLVARSDLIEPIELVVALETAPNKPVPATLVSVDTQADPTTQTFQAEFAFEPPADIVILPGMTGSLDATLRIGNADGTREQISLPLEAILSSGQEQFVWVVDPDSMLVNKRTIEIGSGIGAQIPILSGLAAGDLVVGAGAAYLHEGMQVRRYES